MNLHSIGIDLGNTVFHLVGLSLTGEVGSSPRNIAPLEDAGVFLSWGGRRIPVRDMAAHPHS